MEGCTSEPLSLASSFVLRPDISKLGFLIERKCRQCMLNLEPASRFLATVNLRLYFNDVS